MKKYLSFTLAILLALAFAACGTPEAAESPSAGTSVEAPEVVVFTDTVLEAKVREAMGKPEGDITLAEAEAVEELNLGIEWQQNIPEETQIKDLSGLENFKNLVILNLSFHAVTDISPLAGLDKLVSLSLGGNPVADIAPLAGLTNLVSLTLFSCQAEDYSPLAGLTKLDMLLMEYSTISDVSMLSDLKNLLWLGLAHTQVSDVSPLSTLVNLKKLQLAECPVTDYSPLAKIYPNLEEKDFTMAFALKEIGFTLIDNNTVAGYKTGEMILTVNHSDWGVPQLELEANSIRMYLQMASGYTLIVGYHPDIKTYVFSVTQNDERLTDYVYNIKDGTYSIDDKESVKELMQTVLGDTDSDDILLAPIAIFNDTIKSTFDISADALYTLPFERTSLLSLGFKANHDEAVCVYEQHEGNYTSIAVHRPEWGDQEYSVHFFTSVNGYGVMVRYYIDEQRYYVRAGADDGPYADFEFFAKDNSKKDGFHPDGMTVEQYLKSVYNDPEIADVYLYSVLMAQQYISDIFGMSIDELYALPSGE